MLLRGFSLSCAVVGRRVWGRGLDIRFVYYIFLLPGCFGSLCSGLFFFSFFFFLFFSSFVLSFGLDGITDARCFENGSVWMS